MHKTTFNTPIIIVGQLTLPPFKPDFPAHMDLAGNSNRCCVVSILESERRVVTVLTALFAVCCDVIPTTIIGYATGNKSKLILHGTEFLQNFICCATVRVSFNLIGNQLLDLILGTYIIVWCLSLVQTFYVTYVERPTKIGYLFWAPS